MSAKINLRFFVLSIGCFAVLGAGVYFLNKWQVQRQSGILLAKAQEAETKRDLGKSIDLYGKYLALVPRDVDAQSQYGSLLADARANARASMVFEAVLRLDPARSDVRRKAVKAALAIDRVPDAREHLEQYLLKEFPDDAELLELEGRCQASTGDYLAAGRSFADAIAHDPTRITAYTQLIGLLTRHREELDNDREKWLVILPREQRTALGQDKDWAEKSADYWTDRLVNANPKDPYAYLFRGYRRYSKKSYDAAIQDAEAVLKLRPNDPGALHLAAISCLAADQSNEARDYAMRGVKAAPKDPAMYEVLAQLEIAGKKWDEAIKWLRKGIDEDGPPELWWKLGNLLIAKGNFDEARQTAQALRKKTFPLAETQASATRVGPGLYADLLEAQIAQVQGHWTDATKRFGPLGVELKKAPDLAKQAFYSLGKSYEQLDDGERALKAYRQAVDADPKWILAREAVAASLQSLGRIDEALEELNSLTKLKEAGKEPPLAVWVQLIRLSIRKTSRLPADQQDWTVATDRLNQLAALKPNLTAVPLLGAELLMAKGREADVAEVERRIETEREKNPKEIAFWMAEADLATRANRWDRVNQILEQVEKNFGDSVSLRLARAQYLIRKGENGAAEQLRKLAEKSKDFSQGDQLRLWRGLVSASLAVGDFTQAELLCRRLMADVPGDLRVRMELFDLAAQAKDFKLMDAALDEIRQVESGGPVWHYASALRLIKSTEKDRGVPAGKTEKSSQNQNPQAEMQRQADLQAAMKHLDQALQSRPNWSRALMLQGRICEESHDDSAALAKYLEAVRQGENSPEVAQHAVRLLYGKGEYAAADALLRQLEGQQVTFTTELFREQSRVLSGLQEYAGALKAAQRVAASSKDSQDLLWLGALCSVLHQDKEAENAFQRASQLDEKAPETLVAQVQFYVRTGQKDRAEKVLASRRDKIRAAEAPLALAECMELLGKTDEAGQQYVLALKQKPDDALIVRSVAVFHIRKAELDKVARTGELDKAAEQFARIVGGQVKATAQQLADARGALARVRADQGGYQNLLEAIRLVDENLSAAPSSTDNLRLKARLLAAFPQPARRRESVAILEKLVEGQKNAAAEDRLRLAQAYLAFGDWAAARRQMLALLAVQGNEPAYVAAYAQALLDHDERSEAASWVDRLDQLAPDNPRAAQLRAEIQFRGGHVDDALATLAKFVEKADAGSADRAARTLGAAVELEAIASRPAKLDSAAVAAAKENAERLYRQYVKDDPKQGLMLVDFLARQQRYNEAIELAEEAWKTAEPARIAATCELLLRRPGMTPAQVDRLSAIVSAALGKADTEKTGTGKADSGQHSRPAPLVMNMALLAEKQEKYPQAEAFYRELLEKDGANVSALNNLADLLALGGRQLDEASGLIEKAIALAGPQPALLDTRASVYLALGQAEKAVADMQQVIDQQPAANRYFHLALALQKLDRTAEAADALKKARALQIRPETLSSRERPAYEELVRSLL